MLTAVEMMHACGSFALDGWLLTHRSRDISLIHEMDGGDQLQLPISMLIR